MHFVENTQSYAHLDNIANSHQANNNKNQSCNSKNQDHSTYSFTSESTQSSDYNSQSSDENFKQYPNESNSKKNDIFEESPNSYQKQQFSNCPQMVFEYAPEIFSYLRTNEEKFMPNKNYMKGQKDITENMRTILIDWLVDVHLKYNFLPETLFLTVNLMDRFLSKVAISRKLFQLVGITSLFIACKYEEIYTPDVKDFSQITEQSFSVKQILDMEGEILSVLQFDLTYSSPHRFLERYAYLCNLDEKSMNIAKYLLEISLLHFKMVKYAPSLVACSAIYLTFKTTNVLFNWPPEILNGSNYKMEDITECSKDLLNIWMNMGRLNLNALKRKFSHTNFNEVAKMRFY